MLSLQKIAPEVGGIALREMEPREPGPGEILIRVGAAGICGTDMQIYNWAPRMARRMVLPRVLGHEVSGTVEAAGPGIEGLAVGDRVSLESHIFCGRCRACRLGRAHLCENTRYPGIDIDGAFAEYLTVPASIAWVNPPGLPHETAAMLEPFGIAVHACLAGAGVSGLSVLVNGCGPIGLMAVAVARALGAVRIIACDINPVRLRAAETMGADRAVDAGKEDLARVVGDMTGGAGVDVGVELSGTEARIQRRLRRPRQGRRLPAGGRAAVGHPRGLHLLAAQVPGDAQHPRAAHLADHVAARHRAPGDGRASISPRSAATSCRSPTRHAGLSSSGMGKRSSPCSCRTPDRNATEDVAGRPRGEELPVSPRRERLTCFTK